MNAGPIHRPGTDAEVLDIVADAAARPQTLRIAGGGSKRAMRQAAPAAATLALDAVTGITDYDPDELVLTARAGTPLEEIEHALAARRQMLAFEPFDHAPLFGAAPGRATLGGIVAANVSGPRRLSAGAARDHILGFSGVSGRGEAMKGGGAVVKNVTGFDLPKLMAGSWGTLAVLTSITVRVLPQPRTEKTLVFGGLADDTAHRLMSDALSAPAAVSCAAHLPEGMSRTADTLLRLEGFGPSVDVRCRELLRRLASFGEPQVREAEESAALWRGVKLLESLPVAAHVLWRLSVPPSQGWRVRERLAAAGAQYLYDWGGALVWAALPDADAQQARGTAEARSASPCVDARRITDVARALGGHATLVRPPCGGTDAAPQGDPAAPDALRALRDRVKRAFDPQGVLNPGLDPAAAY